MKYNKLIIYTDGGARGNPGPAGIGAIIKDERGEIVFKISKYIGEATNNQAEYRALISALEKAKDLRVGEITVYLDSELAVKQLNHQYRVKDAELAILFVKVHNLSLRFKKVKFCHINREKNESADRLVNQAIDRGV